MKTNLPKAQAGRIVKTVAKTVKNTSKPIVKSDIKPKVTIPKVDPRNGKPLSPSQIEAIKNGKKLTFHTVDEQNAARDLKKAVNSRTNPKAPAKKSTLKSRESDYEKALWESYQQKGGTVKKKFQDGGSTKSFKNPLTGRTRVTEGWKEKTKTTGTVAPRLGYAEKKVDVYNKKGDKIKTIDKTRQLTSTPKDNDKFISRGRTTYDYKRKVTKYKD